MLPLEGDPGLQCSEARTRPPRPSAGRTASECTHPGWPQATQWETLVRVSDGELMGDLPKLTYGDVSHPRACQTGLAVSVQRGLVGQVAW